MWFWLKVNCKKSLRRLNIGLFQYPLPLGHIPDGDQGLRFNIQTLKKLIAQGWGSSLMVEHEMLPILRGAVG